MATTVTNAEVDTGAAAIDAPWGPLTRVSDVEADYPEPNSNLDIEFTDDLDTTIWMTYEELIDADRSLAKIAQYEGLSYIMQTIADQVDALNDDIAAYSGPPYSYEEYRDTIAALRAIRETQGYYA